MFLHYHVQPTKIGVEVEPPQHVLHYALKTHCVESGEIMKYLTYTRISLPHHRSLKA